MCGTWRLPSAAFLRKSTTAELALSSFAVTAENAQIAANAMKSSDEIFITLVLERDGCRARVRCVVFYGSPLVFTLW